MQRMSITIDDDLKHHLDKIAPKGERAAFVGKAIKSAIEDWHKQRALDKILNFEPYSINQSSTDLLRKVREGRIQNVIDASRS